MDEIVAGILEFIFTAMVDAYETSKQESKNANRELTLDYKNSIYEIKYPLYMLMGGIFCLIFAVTLFVTSLIFKFYNNFILVDFLFLMPISLFLIMRCCNKKLFICKKGIVRQNIFGVKYLYEYKDLLVVKKRFFNYQINLKNNIIYFTTASNAKVLEELYKELKDYYN